MSKSKTPKNENKSRENQKVHIFIVWTVIMESWI